MDKMLMQITLRRFFIACSGLILYEEDISLLTEAFDTAKQFVAGKELESAEFSFTGWCSDGGQLSQR